MLYYLKNYPTYDVLGYLFGFSSGYAYEHLHRLLPVLHRSLAELKHLPERTFNAVMELEHRLAGQGKLLMDAVERSGVRPHAENRIRAHSTKTILYVGAPSAGSVHDDTLLKQALAPKQPWFKNLRVWVDLGFQGVKTDYAHSRPIQAPHKKPRTSKKNPAPTLIPAQKAQNRVIAQVRVAVEHAMGGMKSFHCLAHRIRNRLDTLPDTLVWLCAGLWNMNLVS